MTRQSDLNVQSNRRLEEIARAIGVPVSSFYDKTGGSDATGLPTLVRLFAAINDPQGRDRVIDVARWEAARCQVSQSSEPQSSEPK